MMTMGSLFDGIGGFPLAAIRNGITPVWASEIEAFPIEVTKIRFPEMLHVGDITKLDGAKLPPVDVICGGSPCQDLSVAGQRRGLAGERSGLFMEQTRIAKEMRKSDEQRNVPAHLVRPRYLVWENVPGAFSSNHGQDFLCVLEEIGQTRLPMPEPYTSGQKPVWSNYQSARLPGASSTPSIGACPSVVRASFLSQILEPRSDVPPKCYLSKRACSGILARAEKRTGRAKPRRADWSMTISV